MGSWLTAALVEAGGRAFLIGYGCAFQEPDAAHAIRRIATRLPPRWRGFAVEGAAMAAAVRGVVEPTRRGEFDRFLSAGGERHAYMSYVGLGWALARLPRPFWPTLDRLDPLLTPLVLDGYGFHAVFFDTRRTLERRTTDFPLQHWPGPADDAVHQLAQGVGRGLWFVAGGSPRVCARLVAEQPERLHPSLWAGLGLAATYAGGRGRSGLEELRELSGTHLAWLRQGSAFAAEARLRAGLVTEHTSLAAQVLCGRDVATLSALTYECRPDAATVDRGGFHGYETWRRDIAARLADDA